MVPTLAALAEPNRLRLVEALRDGPSPVGGLAARLRLRQPQVSKHLRVLLEAGLVAVQPVAQQRVYRLRAEPLRELDAWLEAYRRIWEERLDRLDGYLAEIKDKESQP